MQYRDDNPDDDEGDDMKRVEVQILRIGRERPVYAVNIKVDGRAVEVQNFPTRAKAIAAAGDIANKYR